MSITFVPESELDDVPVMSSMLRRREGARGAFRETRAGRFDAREIEQLAQELLNAMRPAIARGAASLLVEAKDERKGRAWCLKQVEEMGIEPGTPLHDAWKEALGIPPADPEQVTIESGRPRRLTMRFRESVGSAVVDEDDDEDTGDSADAGSDRLEQFCVKFGLDPDGVLARRVATVFDACDTAADLCEALGVSKGPLADAITDAFDSVTESGLANFKGKKAPPFRPRESSRKRPVKLDFDRDERERVENERVRRMVSPLL